MNYSISNSFSLTSSKSASYKEPPKCTFTLFAAGQIRGTTVLA